MNRIVELAVFLGVIAYSLVAWQWLSEYRAGITVVASEYTARETQSLPTYSSTMNDSDEDLLLITVNNYRIAHGKRPLVKDERLCQSARAKADDIAQRDYFAHETPEGEQFTAFFPTSFQYRSAAENLVLVNGDIQTSLSIWMQSDSHNQTMLGDYNVACIGTSQLASTVYNSSTTKPTAVVHHFAKL